MMIGRKIGAMVAAALAALTLTVVGMSATAHAASKTLQDAAAPTTPEPDTDGTVNLNTATQEELMLLPGVGASKAQRILDWRQKHGNFHRIEDITKVKGFGYKTFKKLKPHLAVSGTTTYKGKPAKTTSSRGDMNQTNFFGTPPVNH